MGKVTRQGNSEGPPRIQLQAMTKEARGKALGQIRRIHSATCHCNKEYLIQALERRGAKPEVIDLARNFRCPTCEELSQVKPPKDGHPERNSPQMVCLQSDVGAWVNPETGDCWKFILTVGEGSRLRVGDG